MQMKDYIGHEGVIKNVSDNIIYVSVLQDSACAGCHAKSACFSVSNKERIIKVPYKTSSFKEGEEVMVKMHKQSGFKAVKYAFVFPLFVLFFSIFLIFRLTHSEAIAALVAIVSVAVYYFILFLFKDRISRKFTFELEKR